MKKLQMRQSLVTDSHESSVRKSFERKSSCRLNDEQYIRCWEVAESFIRENGSIRNKQIREAAKISYDQAISFFNRALSEKRLVRLGVASGTHYVLKENSIRRRTRR